jgi:hypothetical protein
MSENNKASSGQKWALFCATKFDVRNCDLSYEDASQLLQMLNGTDSDLRQKALDEIGKLPNAICKGKPSPPKQDWRKLYDLAHAEGMKAGNAHNPTPMIVQQHANQLDDNSPVVKQWNVQSGVCGFSWVSLKPGFHPFCKWLKKNDLGRPDSYYGGTTIWCSEFGQSYEKKVAYCGTFAKIVNENIQGISASVMSRLD